MKQSAFARSILLLLWGGALALAACATPKTTIPEPSPTLTATRTPRPTRTTTPTPKIVITPTATAPSEGISSPDLQGVIVKFWHPWSGQKERTILLLINQFNASNPHGIVVTAFSQGSDTDANLRTTLGTANQPHIAIGYNNQIQTWDALSAGAILNLTPYLEDPQWGLTPQQQAAFSPHIWQQDATPQKRFGLPVYRSAIVLFYNQRWAQELGFTAPPTTPDELREQACAAALANNDSTGGLIAATDVSTNISWLMAFEGSLLAPNGLRYQAQTPQNQAALDFLRNLLDMGCAWRPGAYYPNQEFATRKALFYPSSIAGIPYQVEAFQEAQNFDTWDVLPFPSLNGKPVLNLYGPAYAILQSTPETQLASWLFLRWMLEPENQARFIEASGYLPISPAALDHLQTYAAENPLWAKAVAWIPYGQVEPAFGSWGTARWAFGDAIKELFRSGYNAQNIPDLLQKLEGTLNEIHVNNP